MTEVIDNHLCFVCKKRDPLSTGSVAKAEQRMMLLFTAPAWNPKNHIYKRCFVTWVIASGFRHCHIPVQAADLCSLRNRREAGRQQWQKEMCTSGGSTMTRTQPGNCSRCVVHKHASTQELTEDKKCKVAPWSHLTQFPTPIL